MASSMKKSGPRVNNCRNFSVPSWAAEVPPVDAQVAVKADPVDAQVVVKADPVDAQVKAIAGVVLTAKECAPLC